MKMQFNTLPDKLIECAFWCVWKYEDRDGKPTKVPYNPRTGGRAQSNNPATFSDFKTAVAAFGTCKYDGMGIGVFPPFAAIDIDHCVENGILSPLASDIVTHSKSYTEYSPSGKGVRIILTVPDGFKYTLKTVRVKRSETTSQDKATAKTIADTDTMQIQVVHDVLIVTFKGSGDTVYIKLSNKRF